MKTVVHEKRTRPNRQGVGGWFYGGRYGLERYLFILHRLAGLGILLYFIMHIFLTGQKISGKVAWTTTMSSVGGTWFHIGEYLLFIAVAFHAMNGIRLILSEFGWILGKPARPIYPYKTANVHIRAFTWIMMILAVVIMIAGGFDFFLIH